MECRRGLAMRILSLRLSVCLSVRGVSAIAEHLVNFGLKPGLIRTCAKTGFSLFG